ncbi:MAG TPA: universal stress protein [Ohtaekwangia sp.]
MISSFRKIGVAIAFSPRIKAVLSEAARFKKMWNAELVLIHVGDHGEHQESVLQNLLHETSLSGLNDVKVFWLKGKPAEQILATCKKEGVDLLLAGALKKENLLKYYLGTIALKILRKADCSVLMLTDPSETPQPFRNIVVNAEDSPFVEDALATACFIGIKENAMWLHVVREIKMYGLTMSAAEQCSEEEYDHLRQNLVKEEVDNVEKILTRIPHESLKVNIKLVSGKSGFELSKFSQRKHADLLVIGGSPRKFSFFDRVFPHDQEYIFADLPCNILVVHPRKASELRKEANHG